MAYDPNGGLDQNTYNDRVNSINQWFQQYTGRKANDSDYGRAYVGNFGNVENDIRNSDEAKAWTKQQQQQKAPTQPWDRQSFVNDWLPTGNNLDAQNAVLAKYGIDPSKISANGTWTAPDGSVMDIRRGAKAGDNTAQWMGVGGGGAAGAGLGSPQIASSGSPQVGAMDPKIQALYDELLGRAKQGTTIDPNDPVIKAQTDAYAATQDRSRRGYLADLAESAGPGANLQGEARMTAEKVGQNTADMQSQLMGSELAARRDEIAQSLQSMQGLLTSQQQMALQEELGKLNAAIQQQSVNNQATANANQYDAALRQLGLSEWDRSNYWDAIHSGLIN